MNQMRMVCLANSRKLSGRCIAGKDPDSGVWVRPIGAHADASVSESERQYEDGRDPKLLDVVDVPIIKHLPSPIQPENWLIDPEWYWTLAGTYDVSNLGLIEDHPSELWDNGSSTLAGLNDRVPEAMAGQSSGSLLMVRAEALKIRVVRPGAPFGDPKRRVRGAFTYRDVGST